MVFFTFGGSDEIRGMKAFKLTANAIARNKCHKGDDLEIGLGIGGAVFFAAVVASVVVIYLRRRRNNPANEAESSQNSSEYGYPSLDQRAKSTGATDNDPAFVEPYATVPYGSSNPASTAYPGIAVTGSNRSKGYGSHYDASGSSI